LVLEVYHVVEFIQSKTACVVSSAWMIGSNKCAYPPKSYGSTKKVNESALNHLRPQDNWEVFDVRTIKTKGLLME
jgi:UDP-glucose 4-epimerase